MMNIARVEAKSPQARNECGYRKIGTSIAADNRILMQCKV